MVSLPLINLLGHAAGAIVFAIFLCLLFSGRGWSGGHGRYLSGLAATLSLLWNLGSLIVLARPELPAGVIGIVIAASFSVLSLLPAVLLHISLEDRQPALVLAGYLLSAAAIAMHFWEIRGNGPALHQAAILIVTVGFLALAVVAAARLALRGSGRARIVASMCLALFAMSFLHFGTGHAGQAWSSELIIHHAGIPLALLVLLQDYRFVLLDAFIRFLANALLAAVLAWIALGAALRFAASGNISRRPLEEASLLIAASLFLVFFAWLRNRLQAWLTSTVFRQGSLATLAARIRESPGFANELEYLDWAAATAATALRTPDSAVIMPRGLSLHAPVLASTLRGHHAIAEWPWAEVLVPIRLGEGVSRLMLFGRRHGGQRYLGEDLDALAKAAAEIAEKVGSLRREEMNRLVAQAELRALQSQINPHFLFNSLNALYGAIPRGAEVARRMALNLAETFRYLLQTGKTFAPLSEEMQIVRAYLEIEQCRIGSRLEVEIHVDDAALEIPIPVLSVQPLVENAVKHGVAQTAGPGYVRIRVECREEALRVVVENNVENDAAQAGPSSGAGLGLENVRRRLEICYGAASGLRLLLDGETAVAELSIPVMKSVEMTAR
jgi:two-component system, LytTR family, sensor kinase